MPKKFDPKVTVINDERGSNRLVVSIEYDTDPSETFVLVTYSEGSDHGHLRVSDENAQKLKDWLERYLVNRGQK